MGTTKTRFGAGRRAFKIISFVGALLAFPPPAKAAEMSPDSTAFLASPKSPYTAPTAGEFASDCELDQASCTEVIGNVLMSRILVSATPHICLPGISYANAVAPWLKAHPELSNMKAEDAIYVALTKIYKCGPPNNY